GHRAVDRPIERLEGVRKTLDVAGGKAAGVATLLVEERRIPWKELVRPPSMADPQVVGPLGVPRGGGTGAIDFELERVSMSGADLRDHQRADRTVLVARQDGSAIF